MSDHKHSKFGISKRLTPKKIKVKDIRTKFFFSIYYSQIFFFLFHTSSRYSKTKSQNKLLTGAVNPAIYCFRNKAQAGTDF